MALLIYYNPNVVTHEKNFSYPGIGRFSKFFRIYNPTVVVVDRTGTIKVPLRVRSLFPLPDLRPVANTFEELCDARARELLERAERLDMPIYTMWSGGIDSTLVLVSFLKNATPEQRRNITVLLSNESLREYPSFFEDHIIKNFNVDSSIIFPHILGSRALFVSGEHNDQLFGSDIVASVIMRFGERFIHEPYDRASVSAFFDGKLKDEDATLFYVDMFERLMRAAPVPIETNYDYFWWINFALKWQSVHLRTIAHVASRNAHHVTGAYLKDLYAPFFCTDDFQLWSMQNRDKKIKDAWRTYKWVCKDIIYDFTKDKDYRDNKMKRGSLFSLAIQQLSHNYIDDRVAFHQNVNLEQLYEPDNDFA